MPTLTYLGVEVLRLPFIRDTSLGHEVLHNWWGKRRTARLRARQLVRGLTTFMADYAYREQAGAAAALEMRLAWLRDFAALGSTRTGRCRRSPHARTGPSRSWATTRPRWCS